MTDDSQKLEAEPRPFLFDIEAYHRLAKLGFLTKEDRVELLNGVIYEKWPDPEPDNPNPGSRPRRFSAEEFQTLFEIGFFAKTDSVELIGTTIFYKTATESRS